MNINDFFNKWDRKFLDFDHSYGSTCVDLYRQYCQELNFQQSPPVSGAADIWNNYIQNRFQKISNTPLGIPQIGDIIIWNKQLNGYGHVAIFQSGNIWNFNSFDQNWPIGSPCHFQKHNYKYVIGWLRPILPPSVPKTPLQIARIGVNLPLIDDFNAQVGKYSSCKIDTFKNDYIMPINVSIGMLDQFASYDLVDKVNPQEKFIFIFYPHNATSAFFATYYYPKKNCVITTCPNMDARLLTFEFAHQLQIFYNMNRGSNSPVEIIDSNFPSDVLIFKKYNSIADYYQ